MAIASRRFLMSIRRTTDKVEVGSVAPDFSLPSQSGEVISLGDFLGEKPVVLYFYPKDDTPGCTKEACGFRDSLPKFTTSKAAVLGISGQAVASKAKFATKYD